MLEPTVSQHCWKTGRSPIVASTLLILTILFAPLAQAQENTGSIRGAVKDQSGAVIPGATVTAASPTLVRTLEAVTDEHGTYLFPRLATGTYTVTTSLTGFKTVKKEDIALKLGQQITLDFSLDVGNVSETVTVTAGGEALDVASSKTVTNIDNAIFDITPKGRRFDTILGFAPGVRREPKAGTAGVGGYQIDGASGSENAFVIDGVEVSDIRRGSLSVENSIPFEFVREVQVKSAGFEAEYGGATGGVINVATKSGTNTFHGEGAMLFTNAGLNSLGRGLWQNNPTNLGIPEFYRAREDEYRTFYPGFQLGGPLIRDRLHFFTSYFPEANRTERTVTHLSDKSTRTYTTRVLRHYGMSRLDYAPSQKIQINTSYMWNPLRVAGVLPSTDGRIAPPSNDLSIQGGYTPSNAYTAALNYIPTPKLILSARYGKKYLNDKGNAYGKSGLPWITYSSPTSAQTTPPVPADFAGANGFQNVTSTFLVLKDITTRHNVYADASYITRLFGQQHNFKFGYQINRMANDVQDDFLNGRFLINWGEGYTRGQFNNVRGTYGYYTWRDGVRHNSQVSSRNQGFYIQDAWQIHRHITVNAGVRFEDEFLPPYVKEVAGKKIPNPIDFNWTDKIAPRFGGAWDVLGNGKWKLSASYGHFFDTMKYELARGSFGGDYWHDHYYTLDKADVNLLSKANPGALGTKFSEIDWRSVPINAQGQLDGIDPDIKPMESREFSVTTEHKVGSNMILSVRYTRKRLVRGIEDIGILDAGENESYIIGNPGLGATDAFSPSKSEIDKPFKLIAPGGDPYVPKATREYDGVEFRFDGRSYGTRMGNFSYFASYTWSRLWGNWAGLANSDENGRSDPNVSRAFDLFQGNFDSRGRNVFGLLATDRPHTFKFYGNYERKWAAGVTSLSPSQIAWSGTPLSSTVTIWVPVFFGGRGDLGRTPTFTQTDLLIGHTILLTERVKLRFDANVINLFNQAALTNVNASLNRNGNVLMPNDQFLTGFDAKKLVNPNGIDPATGKTYPTPNISPSYALPSAYQGIREIRLGFHVQF